MSPLPGFIIAAQVPARKPAANPASGRRTSSFLQTPSRQVQSNQSRPHPRLAEVVRRHLQTVYRKPVAEHDNAAFARLLAALEPEPRPLVLDSFCGTGHSTALLARRHPDHLVVGVDKSAARLAKHPGRADDGYLLLQANCEAIWQLLADRGLTVDHHYLLYPNPWPRSRQLQRRVHGHPGFGLLLQLARGAGQDDAAGGRGNHRGQIELRSNWQLYVEEFGLAMHLAGVRGSVARLLPEVPLTLFEAKYHRSGHALWVYRCRV
jgi:tRNA (guanine-N7-)-methyltransferase